MSGAAGGPRPSVPPLPGPVPMLRVDDPEVALAGQAGEGRLLLEGERGAALLEERGGVARLHLDGIRVAEALTLEAGVVVNLVASPALVRRERVAPGRAMEEVALLPPRLPLLAVQLRPASAGSGEAGPPASRVGGSVLLLPGSTGVRWEMDGGRLAAVSPEAPHLRLVVALSPDDGTGALEAVAGAEGLRVRITLPEGDAPTLLVAAGPPDGPNPLLPAAHLAGHARMATAAPREGLALATGVAAVDDGVAWARRRLAAAAFREVGGTRPWGAFWSGLGALASGDQASAAAYLDALEPTTGGRGSGAGGNAAPAGGPTGSDPIHPLHLPAAPLPLLLAARLALAVGDAGPALARAARLDPGSLAAAAHPPAEARLWVRALETLADALRWSAGEEEAERYRRLAREVARSARPGTGSDGGGVRLPMVGDAPDPRSGGAASALATLLAPREEGHRAEIPAGEMPAALAPWAALRNGRASEGWALWRGAVDQGLAAGPAGRGSWDGRENGGREAPGTGLLLAGLVHGLLRWEPDAPVGRARLAPLLPAHLTRFRVEGLRVGEATLSLTFDRDGGVGRYRLEPTGGRSPATLVFEPVVERRLLAARVDGEAVELDPRPGPGGWIVPLQIPLDAPRTVELETRPGAGEEP